MPKSSSLLTTPSRRLRILLLVLAPFVFIAFIVALWFPLSKTSLLPPFFRTASFHPFSTPATRNAQWQQDLDYLSSQIARLHANPFHSVDRSDFEQAVRDLSAEIPALTDDEIKVRMMELVAMIGDGHTALQPYSGADSFSTYPLRLYWMKDGFYILATLPEYQNVLGRRLVSIAGTDTMDVFDAVKPLIGHENEASLTLMAPNLLITPEVLQSLGIVDSPQSVGFVVEDLNGEQLTLGLSPIDSPGAGKNLITVNDQMPEMWRPLRLGHPDEIYWFEYLEEEKAVYIQYNACRNMPGKPFRQFTKEVFEFIDNNPVERVIVDLRFNSGGTEWIFNPFMDELEKRGALNQDGKVFTLIGRQTFSSALQNAISMMERNHAILIGEPTSGKPNHYGEVRSFELPNSGLQVSYSTRYFRSIEDDQLQSLMPDLPIDQTIEDYLLGKDRILEAALGYDG